MHDTNSALFACYILFIYFRGQNITRIEREMRALGHPNFHRRILYPRGTKPGWIGKFGWKSAVGGQQSAKGELETDGLAGSPPYEGGVAAFRRRGGSLPGLETDRPKSPESTPP